MKKATLLLDIPVDELKSTVTVGVHELEFVLGEDVVGGVSTSLDDGITNFSLEGLSNVDGQEFVTLRDGTFNHESKAGIDSLAGSSNESSGLSGGIRRGDGVGQETQGLLVDTIDDVADEDLGSTDLAFSRAGSEDGSDEEEEVEELHYQMV